MIAIGCFVASVALVCTGHPYIAWGFMTIFGLIELAEAAGAL